MDVLSKTTSRKPRLLFCASSLSGHAGPLIRVASELNGRGFDVTFLTGKEFHDSIARFGGKPLPLPEIDPNFWSMYTKVAPGIERMVFAMRNYFIDTTEGNMKSLYRALETLNSIDAGWPIVVITETFFTGSHPMYNGAPLPNGFKTRPPMLNINPLPYSASSRDVFPFGPGLAPDSSKEGRARIASAREELKKGPWKGLVDAEAEIMKRLGANNYQAPETIFDTWTYSHDMTLQLCPPSLEYARSDLPAKVRFVGAITPRPLGSQKGFRYPDFWDEITSGEKKVIVTTQGTIAQDYEDLILPTMRAMADCGNIIVVGILGTKGATLREHNLPANARVVDHLPYDMILPYASAFVFNAGYGGLIHGVTNGVPIVLAGTTEDKPEVAMRGEWSGVGINLRTGKPTVKQLADAIHRVLEDPKFKNRAMQIKKENEEMDAVSRIEETIMDLVGERGIGKTQS
ncbi:hypothetical protein B0I35DRAFT_350097 [Stachybotrys elegans]|uniref:Erythromycin biosynthesis protein CIII-like C-terminal domain-containing protein n=1 Tax=Stachybotrys elegans TaxID=80388 RepID=A0A8K0WTR4_9HYPO|nr:hypothetical protein B0I35DRAFT_350097 [Stachybotrys elegans]